MKKLFFLIILLNGYVVFGQTRLVSPPTPLGKIHYIETLDTLPISIQNNYMGYGGIKTEVVFSGDTVFTKHLYATDCAYTNPPIYSGWKVDWIDTNISKQMTPKEWLNHTFPTQDTIPVLMLISDTSSRPIITTDRHSLIQLCDSCPVAYKQNIDYAKDFGIYWIKGYIVRRSDWYKMNPLPIYLDINKQPLKSSIIVWLTK